MHVWGASQVNRDQAQFVRDNRLLSEYPGRCQMQSRIGEISVAETVPV
jgi:hypothetical protein